MTLFASVSIDSPVLETSVGPDDEMSLTLEQQTMTTDGSLDLTVWGASDHLATFEDRLDADETVSKWISIGGTDVRALYRIRLTDEASATFNYNDWTDGKAVVVSAERTPSRWTVDAYLPERSVLQQFAAGAESSGVRFDLQEVFESDQLQDTQQFGLSDLQAETLLTALDQGYYAVPRKINLEELAEPFDVSHQAVSERLRRGVNSLISTTIANQRNDSTPVDTRDVSSTAISDETSPERLTGVEL